MRAILVLSLSTLLIVASCGRGIGPGYSMHDELYFEESPHIVMQTQAGSAAYALRWTYGSLGFFFQPEATVIDGRLYFSLQGTSSSGALSGHNAEIPITDRIQIEALERAGAYWLEPDGTKVRLELRTP